MKTINLIQGTPEWLAHRRTTRNASDAPAMMGVSPYVSRTELLKRVATGIEQEIDGATQARFDKGHEVEPVLRALAEKILGEDLYPVTGVSDDGYLGASLDGVDLAETVLFEAKQHNAEKRKLIADQMIPPADYWQLVQQFAVCATATQCLYLCGDGSETNTSQLWIEREQVEADIPKLIAGWKQFEADVAAYVPSAAAVPAAVGQAPDMMPALRIEVTGMVTASNLAEWREAAIVVFQNISTDLQTDQDFANAEQTVKWCSDIEDQLKGAKQHALSQTASIDELFRTIDAISEQARAKRLELDKLVKARKEAIRGEIVAAGRTAVQAHYDGINASLGQHALALPPGLAAEMGVAIKGKKTVSSIQASVDAAVATAKIAASQQADRVRANVAILEERAEHASLFADRVQLCASKAPEDLRNLVSARIADHQQREAQRLEQERERIRTEELARIAREQAAAAAEAAEVAKPAPEPMPAPAPAPAPVRAAVPQASAPRTLESSARVRLGEINARIYPMSITAEGLAKLGFQPVGTERAAKLYSEAEFPNMVRALGRVLRDALEMQQAA